MTCGRWGCAASARSVGPSPFSPALHGPIGAATLNTPVRLIWGLRNVHLGLAKYPSKYAAKCRPKYPALHIRLPSQLHLSLHLDLNLNLNLDLNPSLYRTLFAKSFGPLHQQLHSTLFGSLFASMFLSSQVLLHPPIRLAKLPTRRPLPWTPRTSAAANALILSRLGPC
jgi:hypothetical protein